MAGVRSPGPRTDDRVTVCALLAVPVVVLSAAPALQFGHWPWICLTLAAPVVAWGGFPSLRRAAGALRGGSCADDVPVVLGTVGALAWSLVALLRGPAGEPGWTQTFGPDAVGGSIRLDVAAGATLALLVAGAVAVRPPPVPGVLRRAVVPVVLATAAGMLGYRLGAGYDAGGAVPAALATLLVAAPAAFDAPTPDRSRDPRVVARRVDTVLFTARALSSGPRRLDAVHPADGTDPDDVLRMAGSVAARSDHPAARTVAAAAAERGPVPDVAEFDERAGLGMSGLVAEVRATRTRCGGDVADREEHAPDTDAPDADAPTSDAPDADEPDTGAPDTDRADADRADADGPSATDPSTADPDSTDPDSTDPGPTDPADAVDPRSDLAVVAHAVLVGHPDLLTEHDIALPAELEQARRDAEEAGHRTVAVAWDGIARAVLAVAADPAPDAVEAVRLARRAGLLPVLPAGSTGLDPDAPITLPVDVRPYDEAGAVAAARATGRTVAVVGASGRDDEALDAGDLAVGVDDRRSDPGVLREAVLALRTLRRSPGPVPWVTAGAVAYHAVALPVAASGALDPLLAGVLGALVTATAGSWRHRTPSAGETPSGTPV